MSVLLGSLILSCYLAKPEAKQIYSGPSGKFKAHVDTPRTEDQFGSLVVCLPFEHNGGALEIRHKGNSITFDWGKEGKAEGESFIRWAAFYSDCEHEVFEVTSGHRLTLTYNLYAVRGNGLLAGHCQTLDATQLPFYKQVVDILKDGTFMGNGMSALVRCNIMELIH